jgi:phosphoglycerate dehydrogenase-like enzyme
MKLGILGTGQVAATLAWLLRTEAFNIRACGERHG